MFFSPDMSQLMTSYKLTNQSVSAMAEYHTQHEVFEKKCWELKLTAVTTMHKIRISIDHAATEIWCGCPFSWLSLYALVCSSGLITGPLICSFN